MTRLFLTFKIIIFTYLLWSLSLPSAFAQTRSDNTLQAPDVSVQSLQSLKSVIEANPDLTDEQKSLAQDTIGISIRALEQAAIALENADKIQVEIENSPKTIEALKADILDLQNQINAPKPIEESAMTGDMLVSLEQDLIKKEGELRNLIIEVDNLNRSLQSLSQRDSRDSLTDARKRLAEVTTELETMGQGELDQAGRLRQQSLLSRQYYHRAQIISLERELAGISVRQQIISLRRDLTRLKVQHIEQDVIRLQNLTGQNQLEDARNIQKEVLSTISLLEKEHPFLMDFAVQNYDISQTLLDLAVQTAETPREKAIARQRRDDTQTDLDTAIRITNLEQVNRQSSATLRRLRSQGGTPKQIKANIKRTQNQILSASQDQLWAQEQLRQLPAGQYNADPFLREWASYKPYSGTALTVSEHDVFKHLVTQRRDLLSEVSSAAFDRIDDGEKLLSLETEWYGYAEELNALLERELLWLPSATPINWTFPRRLARGTMDLFSVRNLSVLTRVIFESLYKQFLIWVFFLALIAAALFSRSGLLDYIDSTASRVGRVKKDNYWLTPSVIGASMIIAVPIPLFFLLLSAIYFYSGNTDPITTSMSWACWWLAGFSMFFLTWRTWNRNGSLLDIHYRLAGSIRRRVARELNWFIPFSMTTMGLFLISSNSREVNMFEGPGLLAFIATAIALAVFGLRVLWAKRDAFQNALSESHFVWRYRQIITIILVGLPLIAAGVAASGYYDTGREILARLFLSLGLMVLTYITHGLLRRTLVVAERRLKLRQAQERREAMIKARKEKLEAESRGEEPPAPLDYDEIDLETISRQTAQLLNIIVWLGFAFSLWVVWRNLFPALSILDSVQIGDSEELGGSLTLWKIVQALLILGVTFFASRNLPGFLDLFVLNRSKIDKGTRYAIVTVLGYFIMGIGLFWAFAKLGTEWSQFQWIFAALGVGIGFGLQEIIANFISGLIILFERPVRVGDYVTIGDQSGTVSQIKIRATTLSDLDNREILIPNKELITGRVLNWTLSNSVNRVITKVGIAYGSDVEQARSIITDIVKDHPKVLDAPAPQVLFLGFGDSSLDFEVRSFVRNVDDRFPLQDSLHTLINAAFEEAGISIPFPQRDLHIISKP